jgi:glycosyltransferase involved in cell wall biosynthesis
VIFGTSSLLPANANCLGFRAGHLPDWLMSRSVVHLTTLLYGGQGRAITDLACAQRASGDGVLVVTSATGPAGDENHPHYLNRLQTAGVPVRTEHSLFDHAPTLNEQIVARLRQLRNAGGIDVLHAHAAVPAAIALRVSNTPTAGRPLVVQTLHGFGSARTTAEARHDIGLLRTVDAIITTSAAAQDFLTQAGVERERITMIPAGISPHAPAPTPATLATMERIRGVGRVVVGCIGAVTDSRNQELLVRALALEGARAVHAVFIGEGGDTLTTRAREIGVADRVHVVGYQPDAATWMGLFDAVVVPSRLAEGGVVVLEAFRAGVPVVASNVALLRELVTDYDTGWLFESEDARSLAAAINRAISIRREIRDQIVDAAARRFLAGYTTEVMVARHAELYSKVAGLLGS